MVLMGLTVGVYFIDLPGLGGFLTGTVVNQTVALIIAIIKALLVIMIFMGVKWSTPLTKLWVAAGFVTFSLMFFILVDYGTRREYEPVPAWDKAGESATPRGFPPGSQSVPSNNINLRPRG
jgi:caa(3)-type oxidase subunit IV